MRQYHLPSIAATLGSVLAGTIGCVVKFCAGIRTARTNGKDVELPMFAHSGDASAAAILRGFLAHEICGHVRHTDFKALRAWVDSNKPTKTARSIQNIIEDGRVERMAWLSFAQIRRILHECVEALKLHEFFGPDVPEQDRPKARVITGMLLRVVRKEYLYQNLETAAWIEAGKRHLGDEVCQKVIDIALRGAASGSTQEVITATEEILTLLREQDQQQEKDPQDEQQEDPSRGSDSEDEEESDDDQSNDGTQNELDEEDAMDTDLADAIKDILDDSCQDAPGLGDKPTNRVFSGDIQVEIIDPKLHLPFQPSNDAYIAAQKLTSKLESLLESVTDEGDQIEDQGRLCGYRLTEAVIGDPFVFSVSGEEKEGMSTAVSVMTDQSYSMKGDKMSAALATAFALSQCLARFEGQGLRFELTAFDNVQRIVKPFNMSWARSKNGLSAIEADGGTSFLDSAMAVAKRLAVQPERRKVAFFATDGDIGSDPDLVFRTLEEQGIEVRVVFLVPKGHAHIAEKTAVQAGLKHWAVAEQPSEIPAAIFKALQGTFVQ